MMKFKQRLLAFVSCAVVVIITYGVYQSMSLYTTDSSNHSNSLDILRGRLQMDGGRRVGGKKKTLVSASGSNAVDGEYQSSDGEDTVIMYDEAVDGFLSTVDETSSLFTTLSQTPFVELAKALGLAARKDAPGFSGYSKIHRHSNFTSFERFHIGIKKHALYNPEDTAIEDLLHDMTSGTFKHVEMMERGTELKLLVTFEDGSIAVLKPMRWGRDHETLPNHYYFNDYERHNSEIASFHLDRLLGFYRVPPVTGRFVNMTSELYDLGEKEFTKTFYVSPIGNLCFFGVCTYYCDSRHSFCGDDEILEVSLMAFLPPETVARRQKWISPYRRSYSKRRNAVWEENSTYCDSVKRQPLYKSGRFLLDLVDMHIFDFLTGNMDRHHVEIFKEFGNYSFLVHLDNGRGFGKKTVDEFSILAPLIQCCVVRESTFLKMAKLYVGPGRLSQLLEKSLKSDPVHPVLAKAHYHALDRRVIHVLRAIAKCMQHAQAYDKVIIKDPF